MPSPTLPDRAHARAPSDAALSQAVGHALAAHGSQPGALLPVLHAVLEELGHVPPAAIAQIADGLNLSRAEVHGVVTFYPDFRTEPPGRHVVRVCRAEACQAVGSDALIAHLADRHGLSLGATDAAGAITLEPVYCLGNCALGPAIMIDGEPHGRVTAVRCDALLAPLRARAEGSAAP